MENVTIKENEEVGLMERDYVMVEMESEKRQSVKMKERKKILVTGGLGHIGSKLIREYGQREDIEKIVILDNLSTQRYSSLFGLVPEGKYKFIEGDIRKYADVEKAVEGVDEVIHLAALTNAPETKERKWETWDVNFWGTKNILSASVRAGIKKFMYASTTSVYGENSGLLDENFTKLNPQTPYAETKMNCERIVKDYSELGLEGIILRKGTIFGASKGMRFHTAVNKFIWQAVNGEPISVWENALEQKRPYLGLNDAIRAYKFLEENGKVGEIYNVLTKNYTVREIVNSIKEYIPNLKIQLTPSPILNQVSYEISDEKIRNIKFYPKDDLRKMIGETINKLSGIKR